MCCMCISEWSVDVVFFFFKQKTAYEMRISDWSSDVCSSDLMRSGRHRLLDQADLPFEFRIDDRSLDQPGDLAIVIILELEAPPPVHIAQKREVGALRPRRDGRGQQVRLGIGSAELGRATGREGVWQYV